MEKIISKSLDDTLLFGKKLAAKLNKGDVIILTGDLGAGKTALVTGVASYWDKQNDVSSPTFTIVNEIVLNESLSLYHMDVYRLEDEDEFYAIGGEEYFDKGITFIEWGENIKNALPKEFLEIKIEKDDLDENVRKFQIIPHGEKYEKRISDFYDNTNPIKWGILWKF